MKPEETIDFHLRWTWNKISRMYNAEAALSGISMSVGFTLLNIDKEGTPSTKLGPKMGMEPRSLTRTLKSMEQDGLIYREADLKDKRMVRVFLTEKGRKMRKGSKDAVLKFNKKMLDVLSSEEQASFFKLMHKINESLDATIL